MGIIPMVDLGALVLGAFRLEVEDLPLAARSPPDLALERAPFAFQVPEELPLRRRGRFVYGRLPPFERGAAEAWP